MNLALMFRDTRAVGAWDLRALFPLVAKGEVPAGPVLVRAVGMIEDDLNAFCALCQQLPYGSVVVWKHLHADSVQKICEAIHLGEWRDWNPPGLEAGEICYVRSHWDGNTYGSHQKYLLEAVCRTTGPVLELGGGDSSTPLLHGGVALNGRHLVTVESNPDFYDRLKAEWGGHPNHRLVYRDDPADYLHGNPDHWGVVFVDHAPGETRRLAVKLAADVADYIVVHDTEDCGYEIFETLEGFPYKRHFRYMRPWTSVVSMTREIFPSPHPEDGP